MNRLEILQKLDIIKPKLANDGIIICGIFGSVARNEASSCSDVDIAYKLDKELFLSKYKGFSGASKIAQTSNELAKYLNTKVDFVSIESINTQLNKNIIKDLIS
jgi:predicted nucleotidyltransferase